MNHSAEFVRCMTDLDVPQARRLYRHVFPHLPQPPSDAHMLIVLHHGRTQSDSVPFRQRAYSHAWLLERALPSGLPDKLRKPAERIYPVVAAAVGIAVGGTSELARLAAPHIRKAMEGAVLEAIGDDVTDPAIIKTRMMAARQATVRTLLGR